MNAAFNGHDMSALAAFMTDTLTVSGPVWRLVGRQHRDVVRPAVALADVADENA